MSKLFIKAKGFKEFCGGQGATSPEAEEFLKFGYAETHFSCIFYPFIKIFMKKKKRSHLAI